MAVVNEQFAKHYWPNEDAVGKHIRLNNSNGTPVEIVGVARTIKYADPNEKPMDFIYVPLTQHPQARMALLLRSERRSAAIDGADERRGEKPGSEHAAV